MFSTVGTSNENWLATTGTGNRQLGTENWFSGVTRCESESSYNDRLENTRCTLGGKHVRRAEMGKHNLVRGPLRACHLVAIQLATG